MPEIAYDPVFEGARQTLGFSPHWDNDPVQRSREALTIALSVFHSPCIGQSETQQRIAETQRGIAAVLPTYSRDLLSNPQTAPQTLYTLNAAQKTAVPEGTEALLNSVAPNSDLLERILEEGNERTRIQAIDALARCARYGDSKQRESVLPSLQSRIPEIAEIMTTSGVDVAYSDAMSALLSQPNPEARLDTFFQLEALVGDQNSDEGDMLLANLSRSDALTEFVRSLLDVGEEYGDIVRAWSVGTPLVRRKPHYNFRGDMVRSDIEALRLLEAAEKGSGRALFDTSGISHFGRYSMGSLLRQYVDAKRNRSGPYWLVLASRGDNNGALAKERQYRAINRGLRSQKKSATNGRGFQPG